MVTGDEALVVQRHSTIFLGYSLVPRESLLALFGCAISWRFGPLWMRAARLLLCAHRFCLDICVVTPVEFPSAVRMGVISSDNDSLRRLDMEVRDSVLVSWGK